MRVLHIFDGDYPWDVRVEKISAALVEAGHQVRILARNRKGRARRERDATGVEIARLPALPGPLSFPLPVNPVWWHQVRGELREFRPDRILVRDLPLAPLAVWLGRRAGIPVVADLAEPYPDSLRSQNQFQDKGRLARWLRNPAAADAVERWVLRRLDCAVVVCPEAAQRLVRQGLPPGRCVEVGNTPRLEAFRPRGAPTREADALASRYVLFFSGLLAGDRGLDLAIEALAELEARRPGRFGLLIVGEGPVREPLAALARERGVGGAVHFAGFVGHDRLPDLIRRADVGLLPFHRCLHIDATLANKLFEYMALALPVVVSDAPPMVRVLRETGAGLVFRGGDAHDLARAIEQLERDPAAARRHGEAGAAAVRARYHWGVDAARLVAAVEAGGSDGPR